MLHFCTDIQIAYHLNRTSNSYQPVCLTWKVMFDNDAAIPHHHRTTHPNDTQQLAENESPY